MASKVSSKLKFTRKDGNAKGTIKKAVIVSQSSGSTTVKSYMKKQRKK